MTTPTRTTAGAAAGAGRAGVAPAAAPRVAAAPPAAQPLGAPLGAFQLAEDTPQRLRIATPTGRKALWLLAALLAFTIGGMRLAAVERADAPAATDAAPQKRATKDWGFFLIVGIVGGLACSFWALPYFRLAYTADRTTRTFTRRGAVRSRTWGREDIGAVAVRVGHDGPREVLVLVLETRGGDEALAYALADHRGVPLPLVAARFADLLGVPVRRAGTLVQAGPDIREALDRVAPEPVGVEAIGDGQNLLINCPSCRRTHVPAVSYDLKERSYGFTHTSNWVKCLACEAELHSKEPPGHLFGRTPEQLESVVVLRLSLIARATAVMALAVCLFPWVGLGMALLATLVNWRTRGWPRPASLIALAVSAVVTVGLTILINS